jgi:phosphate:Na+ symporter
MTLESGIAVIFGSNLGTTVTAWIIGLVGFKMDIKLLSYLFIGIGGLGSVLIGEGSRWKSYFGAMVGFGLIFLGLEGMKESFSSLGSGFEISKYHFDHPWWYAAVGLGLTAIIQSSSAAIAIVQSALFAQMIGFEAAGAFVIGANVGTTVTAFLGAIGGTPDKKRTALAHFLFNVSTGIVALALLRYLVISVEYLLPGADPVIQIALFHTIFNLIGVLIWYPFIGLLSRWLKRFFQKEPEYVTEYIHNVSTELPAVAYDALEKEIGHLAAEIEKFALLAINIPPAKVLALHSSVEKLLDHYEENFDVAYERLYERIRQLEGEILRFIAHLATSNADARMQEQLDTEARKITYLMTAAKAIKDMLHDIDLLYDAKTPEEKKFLRNLRYQILQSVQAFDRAFSGEEDAWRKMQEIYSAITRSYKNTIELITDMAKNSDISSEMLSVAINDMHLSKSFTKSLRNVLGIVFGQIKDQEEAKESGA